MPRKIPAGWITNVLLCDDIRREDNGKMLLIGVYSGDLTVQTFPADMLLRVYGEYRPDESRPSTLTFILLIDGVEIARVTGTFDFGSNQVSTATIALPHLPLRVERACELSVRVEIDGYGSRIILTKPIVLNLFPTVFAPPSSQSPPGAPAS